MAQKTSLILNFCIKKMIRPQRLSTLKSLKIKLPPQKTRECAMKPLGIASLSNFRWQNRKERPYRSTHNEDIAEIAKRPVRG